MDQEQMPFPPLTQLAMGAAQGHEIFMAYVSAGFTREESLKILIAMLVQGMQNNQGGTANGTSTV